MITPHARTLTSRSARLVALLVVGAVALPAQDARELSTPVGQKTLLGATTSTISGATSGGYRLIDIDYAGLSGSTPTFDAVLVRNSSSYATGWWWYVGVSAAQITSALNTNRARLIDLEPYADSAGTLIFACIMVDNTGSNAKAWWWYYNTTTSNIGTQLGANNARLVDLDEYTIGRTTYYSAVMIRNTGSDARSWWWYLNVSAAQIQSYLLTNNARPYDLERRSNGNWNCVMIRDTSPKTWYWWTGLTSSDVGYLLGNYGARPYDLEGYGSGTSRRYGMLTMNNVNALTTDVGIRMRSRTNGQVGCWLEQINGANLADLNGSTQFEPASTMKTLHHVHTMRRVHLGSVSLTQPINVFTNYSSPGSSCPVDTGPTSEQIQMVLRLMMENSDNARTQAITAYFGQSSINSTASSLGMSQTSLNHRLGCAGPAQSNPNQLTLRDLHVLHEAVANGYLGGQRTTFYDLMLEALSDLAIDAVINAEGASLGLPPLTIGTFRAFTKLAHKGGNYSFGGTVFHRAEFGWISIPFVSGGVMTPREYSFGAFVNNANSDTLAAAAIYQEAVPELLRSTIRAALASWAGSVAGVQSVGTGCGSPVYTHSSNIPPHIGRPVVYAAQNGFANAPTLIGIGFSDTLWNGTPLPLSLSPLGSEPGCRAFNDIVSAHGHTSSSTGITSHSFTIPNNAGLVGAEFLTQYYTFNGVSFRSSNSLRSIVGF